MGSLETLHLYNCVRATTGVAKDLKAEYRGLYGL